ncbi:hypothetical protein PR048_028754 [Dryococelus australis]|uniref:Uncharacterized protein n=1 Tax=Dryococelus australis TaxID=614101 RepID=A0ABQ9GF91_9NEOP|nr:hypothetical protein PR048_028754 [Dryococelus australis]
MEIESGKHGADPNIGRILDNKEFYKEAVHLQKQLTLVSAVLDKDYACNLSAAGEAWIGLQQSEELELYRPSVKRHSEEARARLTQQEEMAEKWMMTNKPEYFGGFMAFKIKDPELFPSSMFEPSLLQLYKMTPSKWWKLVDTRTAKKANFLEGFCTVLFPPALQV